MSSGGARPGAGRKPGIPNKINTQLKEMILGALDGIGGQDYLMRQAEENPSAFMTLLGKVLPTTLVGDKDAPLRTVARIELVPVEPVKRADDS